MEITINGSVRDDFERELTVTELLDSLGFAGQPVLVELNGQALFPREFVDTIVSEKAALEIIRIAAGG